MKIRLPLRGFEAPIARLCGIFIGIAGGVLLARVLGPSGRGQFAIAAAIVAVGVQCVTLGLHASLPYFIARNRASARALVAQSLRWMAVASLLFGVGMLGCSRLLRPAWGVDVGSELLFCTCIAVPLAAGQMLLQAAMLGLGRMRFYNWSDPASRLVVVLTFGGLFVVGGLTPLTALVTSSLGAGLVGVLGWILVSRQTDCESLTPSFGEQWSYLWRSFISAAMAILPVRLMTLAMPTHLSDSAIGQWGVAMMIVDTITAVMASVIAIRFVPLVSVVDRGDHFWRVCWRGTIIVMLASFGVTAASVILAPLVIPLFFGTDYGESASILAASAVGVIAYCTSAMSQTALAARGQPLRSLLGPLMGVLATVACIYSPLTQTVSGFGWMYTIQAVVVLLASAVSLYSLRHSDSDPVDMNWRPPTHGQVSGP